MAGGDMRVQTKPIGTIGALNQIETVDAHSMRAGSFTEQRNVGGQNVWLTPAGARAVDELKNGIHELRAERDPGFFSRMLLGDLVGAKGEQHQGRVK